MTISKYISLFITFLSTVIASQPASITLESAGFNNNEIVPLKHTCQGLSTSPQLSWNTIKGAKSYVLIVEDPDAPGRTFTHWIVYNIPGEVVEVTEHLSYQVDELRQSTLNIPENMTAHEIGAFEGINSSGKPGYVAPCPPYGNHRYFFTIYALDSMLNLSDHATQQSIEREMQGHIIGKGQLIGKFQKGQI